MPLSTIDTSSISGLGYGFKNRIINGAMMVWQRGTTFSSSGYAQDRWLLFAPSGSFSASRSTDVPSGFQFSAEMTGTNVSFTQRIESVNCLDLVGGSITVSFWAKNTSGTQDLFVALQHPTAVDNWTSLTGFASTQVSTSPSSNWTYYTVTFNNLPTGVSNGLSCVVGRGAGGATTTRITGVQLEKGSTATSFDYRPYGTELSLCQRYYWQITGNLAPIGAGYARTTTVFAMGNLSFPVQMRTSPTLTATNATGAFGASAGGSDFAGPTVSLQSQVSPTGAGLNLTLASGTMTVGQGGQLYTQGASTFVGFSSEL